jgi:hypothetical protein
MSIDVNVQNDLVIVTESSEDITVNVSNAAGADGVGVPTGGTTGQVLKKLSNTNYDTYWALDGGGVPYSGATGQVDLGNYDLKVQSLTIGKGNNSLVNNTALGHSTLLTATTGNFNTAVGYESLRNTTTGQYNTAVGQSSLFSNTTGGQNTALGLNALLSNTTGSSNVAVGLDTLQHITTGSSNTAIGYNAGSHITGGSTPNTTATNSVFIGRDSKANADGQTNQIVIGQNAVGNGSNTATFGNTATTANYFTGSINGGSFVKSGGTSSQFLKADGSVDSSSYVAGNIYTADGTLTADRTVTSNGNSLTILGGKELAAAEQTALILQTSATNKTTVELNLNNTFTTTGKSWRFRSLSTGAFDIATGVTRTIYIDPNGNVVINGSSAISGATFSVSGTIATNQGMQIQGDINTPLGAGIELVYSGGTSYFTSYNRTGGAWLPIIIRGSQIDLFTNGSNRARLTSAGRLLLGTTTESTFLLDVNGTARVSDNLTVSKNQNSTTIINITNTTSGSSSVPVLILTSDASSGVSSFGKYSSATTPNKIINIRDAYLYNSTAGDISILNDVATGNIKFAAGGSSTAHLTLHNTGNLALRSTIPTTLSSVNAFTFIGQSGAISAATTGNDLTLLNNGYFNGTNNVYKNNGISSALAFDSSGNIILLNATSGTAGNAITYTERMRIKANGSVRYIPMATPASSESGDVYYDSTLNKLRVYNGTSWETITSI